VRLEIDDRFFRIETHDLFDIVRMIRCVHLRLH
jgi:hypothetical protein